MYKFCGLVILLCIIGQVYGHAALVTPIPWWWVASRDRPCGGANYTSLPKAVWPVGSNQSFTWWVIAGDGFGVVHVKLNLAGDANFSNGHTQWLTTLQPSINKLGYFRLTTIVPDVQCTGPNNTCTLQLYTDSGGGWYSCTTVQIVCNRCSGGTPISRDTCVQAGNLPFCTGKSRKQVYVPQGRDAGQIDQLTQSTFNMNHPNPNVFKKGNTSMCMSAYKQMLCELYLPPCGNSSSTYTQSMCSSALSTCGLTTGEQNLYNCSVFPTTIGTTTSKVSTTTTTTSKSTTGSTTGNSNTTTTKSASTSGKISLIRDEISLVYEENGGPSIYTIGLPVYALFLFIIWVLF